MLRSNWQEQLRELKTDWNSYGSKPITDAAISTIESFATTPTNQGGIQLEIHRDGYDIEIEIDADGRIVNCLLCHGGGE